MTSDSAYPIECLLGTIIWSQQCLVWPKTNRKWCKKKNN
jgi:hypothetical protein